MSSYDFAKAKEIILNNMSNITKAEIGVMGQIWIMRGSRLTVYSGNQFTMNLDNMMPMHITHLQNGIQLNAQALEYGAPVIRLTYNSGETEHFSIKKSTTSTFRQLLGSGRGQINIYQNGHLFERGLDDILGDIDDDGDRLIGESWFSDDAEIQNAVFQDNGRWLLCDDDIDGRVEIEFINQGDDNV